MHLPDKLAFCERYIFLHHKPISFAGRPYLPAIYESNGRRLVIQASRQVEKSTFLANSILHAACHPGTQILFVCPRQEQASVFSSSRLVATLNDSPVIRRLLMGQRNRKLKVMNLDFVNGSRVFIRAAFHNADAARGISADLLILDEFQDIADGHLPVLEETLSHSTLKKVLITGTPKTVDNHLESVLRQSTGNEWQVPCPGCRRDVILDERCLGPVGPLCPNCQQSIDPRQGRWVARNPQSRWGDGFWINHLMTPWVNYDELLERQRTYDPVLFKNECLGLPTLLGDHIVTRSELEACCDIWPMSESPRNYPTDVRRRLVAGIDWGGGGRSRTLLVIGFLDQKYRFNVVLMERFVAREDPEADLAALAERCGRFGIQAIAADGGGNGHVLNRLLLDRLKWRPHLYAIQYSTAEHEPRQDGALWRWTVNRSASIGSVFSRIKKGMIRFPKLTASATFLDEIICEVAEYDDHQRTITYTHAETQPDDTLHALNYALLIAIRGYGAELVYGLGTA